MTAKHRVLGNRESMWRRRQSPSDIARNSAEIDIWFTHSPPSWATSVVFSSSKGQDCSSGQQKSCCKRPKPRRTMAGVEALLRVAGVTAWQWEEALRRETCGPPVGSPAYTTSLRDNSWRAGSDVSGPTIKPHVRQPRFLCGPRRRFSGGGDPKATWSQQERPTTPDKAHGERPSSPSSTSPSPSHRPPFWWRTPRWRRQRFHGDVFTASAVFSHVRS